MIDLYHWPTPNGHKVTMFLEEADLQYRIQPIDISAGDQFKPEWLFRQVGGLGHRPTVTEEGNSILFGQTAATTASG